MQYIVCTTSLEYFVLEDEFGRAPPIPPLGTCIRDVRSYLDDISDPFVASKPPVLCSEDCLAASMPSSVVKETRLVDCAGSIDQLDGPPNCTEAKDFLCPQ